MQAGLNQYLDTNGKRLPQSVVKTKNIPRQIASQSEAETVETTAALTTGLTTSTSTVNCVLVLILQSGLS